MSEIEELVGRLRKRMTQLSEKSVLSRTFRELGDADHEWWTKGWNRALKETLPLIEEAANALEKQQKEEAQP